LVTIANPQFSFSVYALPNSILSEIKCRYYSSDAKLIEEQNAELIENDAKTLEELGVKLGAVKYHTDSQINNGFISVKTLTGKTISIRANIT